MSRLPALTYRDVIVRLRQAGFVFDRQAKGSHEIWYNHETHRRTTVPNYPGTIAGNTARHHSRSWPVGRRFPQVDPPFRLIPVPKRRQAADRSLWGGRRTKDTLLFASKEKNDTLYG